MNTILTRKVGDDFFQVYCNKKFPKNGRGEFLYVLTYKEGERALFKIGTTNDIRRRMYEHLKSYKSDIVLCWFSPPYSKYTVLRVEDKSKEKFKKNKQLEYKRNDRFYLLNEIKEIEVIVRKTYQVPLVFAS